MDCDCIGDAKDKSTEFKINIPKGTIKKFVMLHILLDHTVLYHILSDHILYCTIGAKI